MTSPVSARLPVAVWGLALCQALLVSGNVLLIASSPLIGAALSPSADWSTLPVAAQLLGLTAATLPAGWLTARLGRKRTFLIGNLVGLAGIVGCLLALIDEHFWLFNLGTFAIGMSIGVGMLYRFAAVDAADIRQRDSAISLVMAGGIVAALLGPWMARRLQNVFEVPFLGSFFGLAGLYLAALIILQALVLPDPNDRDAPRPARSLHLLLRQPQSLAAIASAALGYAVMNLAMTATPLAMSQAGHAFGEVASVIQWHMLAMFAPSFFTGRLTRRFGHANMIAAGAVCLLGSALCAWLTPQLWAFGAGLLLLGLGWNFTFLPASAWLTTTYRPAEAPRVQAVNDCIVFSLTCLSALLAGPLNAWLGWQALNLVLIPAIAVLLAIAVAMRRRPGGALTAQQ